jgi:hypothetical protein
MDGGVISIWELIFVKSFHMQGMKNVRKIKKYGLFCLTLEYVVTFGTLH